MSIHVILNSHASRPSGAPQYDDYIQSGLFARGSGNLPDGTKGGPTRCLTFASASSRSLTPLSIQPSSSEIQARALSLQNLELAVRSVHEDGLVVIENAIPHGVLDHLNEKMVADARMLQARGKDAPFNYNLGNIQQDPPPIREYFERDVFLNPIATQITSAVLGPRPLMTFCSGNSAMPPTPSSEPQRQPVHSDADFAHPNHPFALVVNIPLITMTPENGSTEIWLGTHLDSGLDVQEGEHGDRASGRIKEHVLEERRTVRGPSQPVIPKGSIVVRDLRLWHAGMPNWTEEVRVMLAMIHFAPWYRNPMKLELSEEIKPLVDSESGLDLHVNWVKESEVAESYLNRGFGNSYDFSQTA
ncbi:hypothetical protein M430DRAFT_48314 [Amorphotheca resinae ATCC 22711]|uniref:Phytanoyl-CoA dioxygenase family protein n=1 Tax=Amorphotheca resinae ATCC 22711 TaxID=857342 RepID=A0A2T3BC87_AMORE|nr:hypothetical protein M430DRAFT_48314 [Amorphotheca resinae ATCC 22711]PSS25910.1 hypothetical protein M430DRAFT_48314 [Amorphotheca resinae ATCC 22711]